MFLLKTGMSGGPCYLQNENKIVGVHSTGCTEGRCDSYGTSFTAKSQELFDFAKQYIEENKKVQPPPKKQKKISNFTTISNGVSIWHPTVPRKIKKR